MTGRELIRQIVDGCEHIDQEVPIHILQRNHENVVTGKDVCPMYSFINGILRIEAREIIAQGAHI